MRVALALVLASCAAPPPPRPPLRGETAWILSGKLDVDAQEFILRAYDEELTFPFAIAFTRPAPIVEGVTWEGDEARARPADLAALVASPNVTAIRCATKPAAPPDDDAWRVKVDVDVRTIYAANSACWTAVRLEHARDPSDDEWASAVALGLLVQGRDARSSLVYVPVRAVPRLAMLPFVARVEAYVRVFGVPR